MRIQSMFRDDINRKINGVVKVDQDEQAVLVQELDENGKPKTGSDGKPVYRKERYSNPLRAVYGEYYVRDLKKINDKLSELVNAALSRKKKEEQKAIASKYPKMVKLDESTKKYSFRSMAKTISVLAATMFLSQPLPAP